MEKIKVFKDLRLTSSRLSIREPEAPSIITPCEDTNHFQQEEYVRPIKIMQPNFIITQFKAARIEAKKVSSINFS